MNEKISVIVPCFNQAQYLDETLGSIHNQTYLNWECIIVNDGSTDNTKFVSQKWCDLDSRFSYFYKENGGLSSARNFGLNKAQGQYIQFLDSDDLLKHNKFELQLLDLKESQIAISNYFPFEDGCTEKFVKHRYLSPFFSEDNYKEEIIIDWEYRKSIPCHAVLFEKELIEREKIRFDENLPNHEDWDFWVRLFYNSMKIKNNNEILALYRIHKKSMTMDFKLMKIGFLKAAKKIEKYFINQKNIELSKVAKKKYKEIYNKGRVSIYNRLKSKIFSKVSYFYKHVNKN